MSILEDGVGTGNKAKVDSDNRLLTKSTMQSNLAFNSTDEDLQECYIFSTGGFISITTTDTETGVFYVKNTSETKKLILSTIRTCGNQVQKVVMYKNPTGGTLVTDQTAGQATNLNFTSANEAAASTYKGADGKTVTGGTHLGQHINNTGHSTEKTQDALILGRNDSFAITFELAVAGTVCVAVEGYFI
jgi:hypothetical protein